MPPLVPFRDKDALSIEDPEHVAYDVRADKGLRSRDKDFSNEVRMIYEKDGIALRLEMDKVSEPFGHFDDEIKWSLAQTTQCKALAAKPFWTWR